MARSCTDNQLQTSELSGQQHTPSIHFEGGIHDWTPAKDYDAPHIRSPLSDPFLT